MNEDLIRNFETLYKYYGTKKYKDIVIALRNYPEEITSISQLKRNIFTTEIKAKILEFIEDGEITEIDKIKQDMLVSKENKNNIFKEQFIRRFYNLAGDKTKANEWWNQGYRNVESLLKNPKLTRDQKIILKYFGNLQPLNNTEVIKMSNSLNNICLKRFSSNQINLQIVGQLRRVNIVITQLDILVMISIENFQQLIKYLQSLDIIKDIIYVNQEELLAITKINDKYIKLHMIRTPRNELGSYLLWYTGNVGFLKILLQRAKIKGMRLTKNGLIDNKTWEQKNTLNTEEEILQLLDCTKFLNPQSRNF